jgi:hypothetical protein
MILSEVGLKIRITSLIDYSVEQAMNPKKSDQPVARCVNCDGRRTASPLIPVTAVAMNSHTRCHTLPAFNCSAACF